MNKPMNEQLKALVETVERLRLDQYPDLDGDLVRQLLEIHADIGAAEADYGRAVEQTIEQYLSDEVRDA